MKDIIRTLRQVYRQKYILFNIAALLIYYLAYDYLVQYQQLGLVIITAPIYLVYALLVTASSDYLLILMRCGELSIRLKGP